MKRNAGMGGEMGMGAFESGPHVQEEHGGRESLKQFSN